MSNQTTNKTFADEQIAFSLRQAGPTALGTACRPNAIYSADMFSTIFVSSGKWKGRASG